MPQVRNYYHRPIKCPLCQKTITQENQWFCSPECEHEWNQLNKNIKTTPKKSVRGSDTSS